MKYTSVIVLGLLMASTQAVRLNKKDVCGSDGHWCNKGLSYDYDEKPLRSAEADNAAKT